jgi:serine/threonine protein kinase
MTGRTIGKYHIVGQLGRGATGIVYKAIDRTLDREVAIKVLNPDLANPDIVRRFRAEATTLARLNHPDVATIYELLPSGDDLLMVMELVRGETLDRLLERIGPLAPELAGCIVDRILSALEHAHRAGIIHRDMKPANVMITTAGGVKIMDFGIARVRGAEHLTVDGLMIGTPAYMAPEQGLGEDVDERTDLYSVGVILYRLLTGALAFKADSPVAMLQRKVLDTPAPLSAHREALPDWCEPIVQRALARSPADRFQTAEEFREALRRSAGLERGIDLAKVVTVRESDMEAPEPGSVNTFAVSRTETMLPVASTPAGVIAGLSAPPETRWPPALAGLARHWSKLAGMIPFRATLVGPMGRLTAGVLVAAAVLAYVTVGRPATELITAAMSPPVTFETKVLVGSGRTQRQPDAQLLLADGKITVIADGDTEHPLYSVAYRSVISLNYSRGSDPVWNSPEGPAVVARVRGGVLGGLGIYPERHWVSLRTDDDRFIVLRVSDAVVGAVLSALEERTGRTAERLR